MAKRRWRWVTRDDDICRSHVVEVKKSAKRPEFNGCYSGVSEADFDADAFAKITGITIKPGNCIKVEFSAKVVEP